MGPFQNVYAGGIPARIFDMGCQQLSWDASRTCILEGSWPGSSKGMSIIGPRVLRPRPAGSSRGTKAMFGIIRVSKPDHFRSGSGSRSEVCPTPPRGSDPNRPKVLKITVTYRMELGGSSRWSPLFGHSPRFGRITIANAIARRGAPQLLTPLSKILAGTLPEPAF